MDLDVGVLESACLFVFGRFAPVLLGKGREGTGSKTVKELEKRPARHKSLIAWRIQTPYWLDASGRVAEESRKQQEPNIKPPHFSGIIQIFKLREKERR